MQVIRFGSQVFVLVLCVSTGMLLGWTSDAFAQCEQCSPGEVGCEYDGVTPWMCECVDGQCCEKQLEACQAPQVCNNGVCGEPCSNSCTYVGDSGCEDEKTAWMCVQNSANGCLEKKITDCGNGTCKNGECHGSTCTDECSVPGEKGCWDDQNAVWTCVYEASEGCKKQQFAYNCGAMVCDNGECVERPTTPDQNASQTDVGDPDVSGQDTSSASNDISVTDTGDGENTSSGDDSGCQISGNGSPLSFFLILVLFAGLFYGPRRRRKVC